MGEWGNAILFGVVLIAFVLGLSNIIMGFMSTKQGAEGLQEKIEYGFLGVSGLIVSVVLTFAMS